MSLRNSSLLGMVLLVSPRCCLWAADVALSFCLCIAAGFSSIPYRLLIIGLQLTIHSCAVAAAGREFTSTCAAIMFLHGLIPAPIFRLAMMVNSAAGAAKHSQWFCFFPSFCRRRRRQRGGYGKSVVDVPSSERSGPGPCVISIFDALSCGQGLPPAVSKFNPLVTEFVPQDACNANGNNSFLSCTGDCGKIVAPRYKFARPCRVLAEPGPGPCGKQGTHFLGFSSACRGHSHLITGDSSVQQLIDAQNSTIALLIQELEQLRTVALPNISFSVLQAYVDDKTAAVSAQVTQLQAELARAVEASLSRRLPPKLEEMKSHILDAASLSLQSPLDTLKQELCDSFTTHQRSLGDQCLSAVSAASAKILDTLERKVQALETKFGNVAPQVPWSDRVKGDGPVYLPECQGDHFQVGDLVRPHSLATSALNGLVGCVRGFVGERVQVEFLGIDGCKLIEPAFLVADSAEEPRTCENPCGQGGSTSSLSSSTASSSTTSELAAAVLRPR
ncbi:unnamed protein product [Prorocentrum cordatum]|uniref:Uncharacterized protein n=1 Tax=Prorocentrum cordatum TaxID=2364126 RepID=A0ABN9RNW3_9DINO|nr:unnamed protein product [Polarella glacialis]